MNREEILKFLKWLESKKMFVSCTVETADGEYTGSMRMPKDDVEWMIRAYLKDNPEPPPKLAHDNREGIELKEYWAGLEFQHRRMNEKLQAAAQLIGRLMDPEMREDAESYRDSINAWLEKQKIEYNTHAGWCVSALTERPDPEQASGLHRELIRAATDYYRALDEGRDPGPAKDYLDMISALKSDDPHLVADAEFEVAKLTAMLEMRRLVSGVQKKN